MKRFVLILLGLFGVCLALHSGRALANDLGTVATNKAACYELTTSLAKDKLDGIDLSGDERFFMQGGFPPNIHFLLDTSGSMQNLPEEDLNGFSFGAYDDCASTDFNDTETANGWSSITVYPPPDPGSSFGTETVGMYDAMFPNLAVFRDGNWGNNYPGVMNRSSNPDYATIADACTALGGTNCLSCLQNRGYYRQRCTQTNRRGQCTRGGGVYFTGNFLRFDPPKFVTASSVLKQTIIRLRNARVGLSTFDANSNDNYGSGAILQQGQKPACDSNPMSGQTDQNIGDYLGYVDGLSFDSNTPLAESLFNIGQYFSTVSQWQTWFGTTTWANGGYYKGMFDNDGNANCWSCAAPSVVIITDGLPTADTQVPVCSTNGNSTIKQLNGNVMIGSGSCNRWGQLSGGEPLDDVAAFEHNHLNLNVYGIGFGEANPVLQAAASAGGGSYHSARNSTQLAKALASIIQTIDDQVTTYTAASVNSLEVNASNGAILPRMRPSTQGRKEPWQGFLYKFNFVNEEFLDGGCDPVAAADGGGLAVGDLNDDGLCDSVLLDKNNALVSEGTYGFYVNNDPTQPAQPFWEAGQALADLADGGTPVWEQRKVFTVVDTDNDGKIDSSDVPIAFDDSDAGVAALMPYLGIDPNDPNACDDLAILRGQGPGGLTPADCARVVIDWYRGADTLSSDPSRWDQDQTLPDGGLFILKDIFHSSPVEVDPPAPASLCNFSNQCTATLFKTDTPMVPNTAGADAYDLFQADAGTRDRLILVGSNGGMLHAFDDGQSQGIDSYTGLPQYTQGNGQEVWAFVPPDLLPKLKTHVGQHGFFVDASAMVRDSWIDLNGDGQKQRNEFRTIAVVGEGRGGVHHFALDLTDLIPKGGPGTFSASSFERAGTFLWLWPQPGDPLSLRVGESFSNYAPRPPPIGAVALDDSSGPLTVAGQHAKEEWVVFLNGGYDAYLSRGRGLAMVDLKSGNTLWSKFFGDGTPRADQMRYPFAAGVGMVDIDDASSDPSADYLFDTATVPDLAGDVWTVRFREPGRDTDSDGKIDNWTAARAFEASSGGNLPEPFTQQTANGIDVATGELHTYLGSGDRYNLTDTGGPHCRLSNPYACAEMGCAVSTQVDIARGGWFDGGVFSETSTASFASSSFQSGTNVTGSDGADVCSAAEAQLAWNVPDTASCATGGLASGRLDYQCGPDADGGFECATVHDDWTTVDALDLQPSDGGTPLGAYYGFVSYGGTHVFSASDGGSAYDTARLHPSDLTDVSATTSGTDGGLAGSVASSADNGWMIQYSGEDERTATGSAIVDGCVIWNTFQSYGSDSSADAGVSCSSGGSHTAALYQASVISGAPDCAQAFGGMRKLSRTVAAAPGEPVVQRTLFGGQSSTSIVTLERKRSQSNSVSTANDPLRVLYQLQPTQPEHQCRHVSGANGACE